MELERLRQLEEAFLNGHTDRPKVAYLCLRVPPELIEAAGAVPIRIAPRPGFDTAVNGLIRSDGCSFCRSVPAILETGYYENVQAVIGGQCCDQMRRLLDTLQHDMEIPVLLYGAPRTWDSDKAYFLDEFQRTFQHLFDRLGIVLDSNRLTEIVQVTNRLKKRVAEMRTAGILPNNVLQQLAMSPLPAKEKLEFLEQSGQSGNVDGTIRIGLAGSIPGVWELAEIERCGGNVVADVTCLGDRVFLRQVEESGDLWENLYDAYIEANLCPHRRPINPLIDYIRSEFDSRDVQGVIYRSVKYCHPWGLLAERMRHEIDLPMLVVDDDLTSPAVGNFRTRVGAFIEMLQSRNRRRA